MINSHLFILPFLLIHIAKFTPTFAQPSGSRENSLFATAPQGGSGRGSTLCALDTPSTVVGTRSAIDCAQRCARVEGCEAVNVVSPPAGSGGSKSCQMFLYSPGNFATQPGCTYYAQVFIDFYSHLVGQQQFTY